MFIFRLLILMIIFISQHAVSRVSDTEYPYSTNKIVEGILSFSHWPRLSGPPILCVSPHVNYFKPATESKNYLIKRITQVSEFTSTECNAIYFGQEPISEQNSIINAIQGESVLTISEDNIDCVAGSAFCINKKSGGFHFSVNLDSLTRSGVRVNPEVLLLSKDGDR